MKKKFILMLNLFSLTTMMFLILGFQYRLWSTLWVLFLLPPLVLLPFIIRWKHSLRLSVLSLYTVSYGYVIFNMYCHNWHPTWLVFFVPIVVFFKELNYEY